MVRYTDFLGAAPNEQISKFSVNRAFQKLHANDVYLSGLYEFGQHIKAYSPDLVYAKDDYVWYKHARTDLNVYLLRSLKDNNTFVPTVIKQAGLNTVVSDQNWSVCNAQADDGLTIIDSADVYLAGISGQFVSNHQSSQAYHKNGVLRKTDSNILLKSLANISEERSKFLYPQHTEGIAAGGPLSGGCLRKWPNGMLEYDLQYRFDENSAVLSANNLKLSKLADNALYFADESDRSMFDFAGTEQLTAGGKEYRNLANTKNAFTTTIHFQQPFKDTNYMLFTSQLCATYGKDFSPQWKPFADGTNNFTYQSLTITDTVDRNAFNGAAVVSSAVVNIGDGALSAANRSVKYRLSVDFGLSPTCRNIGDYAFQGSYLTDLNIPQTVRHVGLGAINGCDQLQSVTFNVHHHTEPNTYMLPPKMFADCHDSLSIYVNATGGTAETGEMSPLYDILTANYNFFGLKSSDNIFKSTGGVVAAPLLVAAEAESADESAKPAASPNDGASSMDLKSFMERAKQLLPAKATGAAKQTIDGYVIDMTKSTVIGVDPTLLDGTVSNISALPLVSLDEGAISGVTVGSIDFTPFRGFSIKYHAVDSATVSSIAIAPDAVIDACAFTDSTIGSISLPSITTVADGAFNRCHFDCLELPSLSDLTDTSRKFTNCTASCVKFANVDFMPAYALSGLSVKSIWLNFSDDALVEQNAFACISGLAEVQITGIKRMAKASGCFQNALDATFYGFQENAFVGCASPIAVTLPDIASKLETSPYYQTFAFEVALGNFNRLGLPEGSTIKTKARAAYSVLDGQIVASSFAAASTRYSGITIEDGVIIHARPTECTHYVNITDEVSAIGDYAFANCTALQELHFAYPSALKSIGDYAFYNCTGLSTLASHIETTGSTSATVDNTLSVDSVGSYAFYNTDSLTCLTFKRGSSDIPTIGAGAFYNSGMNTLTFKTGNLASLKSCISWTDSSKDPMEMPARSQIKVGGQTYDSCLVQNANTARHAVNANAIVFIDKTPSSVKALYIADSGTTSTPVIQANEVFRLNAVGKWK